MACFRSSAGRPAVRLKGKVAIVLDLREVARALGVARIGEVAAGALAAVLLAVAEVDGVDRDLDGLAAVAVLVLVAAAGELALDEDEAALAQVLADELGLRAPCDALDEVGDLLAVLGLAAGVAGEGEAGDRRALLRVSELGVGGETAFEIGRASCRERV